MVFYLQEATKRKKKRKKNPTPEKKPEKLEKSYDYD
jgi:hypothetical protein